jgi:signal transduction histidine kinase
LIFSASTRNALTGRWAISRDAYLVLAPTSIISVVLAEATTFQAQELGGWLVASAGGYAVFCSILYMAHKTLFRNRHVTPVPIWWIFALGLTAGAIKGSATAIISIFLNLDDNVREAVTSRMFAAGLLGLFGVAGVAVIVNSLGEFRYKRAELIAEQILIESKELQSQDVIAQMSTQLRSSIESDLGILMEDLKNSLEEKIGEESSWQLIADDLRSTAKETVRDMSHKLWGRDVQNVPDINLVDIARAMITISAFPLRLILPVLVLSAIPQTIKDYGIESLIFRMLLLIFTTAVSFGLGMSAIHRWPKYRYQIYVFALISAVTLPPIYGVFLLGDEVDQHFLGISLTIAIWIPMLAMTCGLIDTALKQRQEILDGLQSQIDKSRVRTISENNETIRLSNDMAKYLHGNLQSRLMASAFAIEAAGNAHDSKTLSAEIEKARQSIATPFDQFTSQELGTVSTQLSQLLAMWEGVLTTKIEFSGLEEHISIIDTRNIVHVVEEAFSNALRHGLATEATIVLNSTSSEIALAVIDNGIGPRDGTPGLGSSLFNSIAGSNWTLSRGPEGIGAELNLQITK